MEDIDLRKKLENAPKGLKLYSPIFGEVNLLNTGGNANLTIVALKEGVRYFENDGKYHRSEDGECMLFPSKTCRDWDKFQCPEVGDKIEYDSKEYTVSKLASNGFTITICDTVSTIVYYTDNFKIIKEEPFKVGDVVKCKGFSDIFTVESVCDSHMKLISEDKDNDGPFFLHRSSFDEASLITDEELRDKYCMMLNNGKLIRWLPKEGEMYYYINRSMKAIDTYYTDIDFHKSAVMVANCFPTKEMAEKTAKRLKTILKKPLWE